MNPYRERIVDQVLRRRLAGVGAVLVEGPKWCGKTTTAAQQAKTIIYMDDPEEMAQNLTMADLTPKALLKGETPILIDEWQIAPKLWGAVRFEVDHRDNPGQFILAGSAVPADTSQINHSGTGRFSWLTMRPMSLYESGDSSGDVSFKDLFDSHDEVSGQSLLTLDDIAF